MYAHPRPVTLRFGEFELDLAAFSLRRRGRAVRVERKPLDVLVLLVERRGQLVTRTEIAHRLWGPDVFVDIDSALNSVIRKVRQALRDSVEAPTFVETVTGRGYRFIASVDEGVAPGHPILLAVLPFVYLGGSAERDYIADGFTDEAIAALGQLDPSRLRVIGRTSVMRYKVGTISLAAIGEELGVTHVLEGSIRAEGSRCRVTTTLIRLPEQTQLWSGSYDSQPSDMLEFQRSLCAALADQIRLRLDPGRLAALERRRSPHADAYDLYLQGRHLWNRLTPETSRRAVECYRRATELDGGFALAWSGLADAYAASPITGDVPPLMVWPRAKEAVARALSATPSLAESQTSAGLLHYWLNWDWPAAESAYRAAIDLDPGYVLAPRMLGVALAYMGRHDEARTAMRRARELDPLYAMHQALSAHVALLARAYEEGLQFARHAMVIDPHFWIGYFQFAQLCERVGRHDDALEALVTGERFNGNSKMLSLRGYIYARQGRVGEARQVLQTLAAIGQERYVPPYASALVHMGLDEIDVAFEWLDRAVAARDVHLIFVPVDPKWDHLRLDARLRDLLRRCGFGPM